MVDILIGIGNELGGDDYIGSWIAKNFKHRDWLSIDCATAPENFISLIEKRKPCLVVVVDAAELGLAPGEFRIVPKDKLDSVGIGTHSIPLSLLISYLEKYAENVICIGVQPKTTKPFSRISKEVKRAGERIIEILKEQKLKEIPGL
ncbi:MAG: hydrogenase 3 maturation endopeptidase HyCI [Candidatus Thermoplasmatota archaeon]